MKKKNVLKSKLKKDDQVKIMCGKEIGNTGRILKIDRKNGSVIVEGCNMVKKAVKQKKQNQKGGIMEIEGLLNISNVMIVCKKCGPTRVSIKRDEDKRMRICKKCGEEL